MPEGYLTPREDPDSEPRFVCSQCWVDAREARLPLSLPPSLRERVPCVRCGFVTDSGIVVSVTWLQRFP